MRRVLIGLASVALLAGCGGASGTDASGGGSSTPPPKTSSNEPSAHYVQTSAKNDQLGLVLYCSQVLDREVGKRSAPPSRQATLRERNSLFSLVELAHMAPHATYHDTGISTLLAHHPRTLSMRGMLLESAQYLRHCGRAPGRGDVGGAQRLERAARTLPQGRAG